MKNIFLDCGTQLGQGLKNISKLENIKTDWDVYSFEANPITFLKIERNNHVRYFNVAVSDSYGFSTFNCEEWDADHGFTGGGSTLIDLNNWNTERVYGVKPNYVQTLVPTIDLIDFIKKLNPEEKSIVLKLDIEGCEYRVLKKIQENNFFKFFKKIYIEFHDHLLTTQETNNNSQYWIQYCYDNNIEIITWH